jgi:penicillin amidase
MAPSSPNSGRNLLRIEFAGRRVDVERDAYGVPHVQASTWLDALFGLGYMHALDRGTQVLFAREVASGQGAARIVDKPELIETDRFFRRVGLHLNLEAEVAALDDHLREQIEAYCAGVNHAIGTSRRSLPMWVTGFRPDPWDVQAVLLVGKLLSFGGLAVSQMQNERLVMD